MISAFGGPGCFFIFFSFSFCLVKSPLCLLFSPISLLQSIEFREILLLDGGRSMWEKSWSLCRERQHGQKSHPINPETPIQSRSGMFCDKFKYMFHFFS